MKFICYNRIFDTKEDAEAYQVEILRRKNEDTHNQLEIQRRIQKFVTDNVEAFDKEYEALCLKYNLTHDFTSNDYGETNYIHVVVKNVELLKRILES